MKSIKKYLYSVIVVSAFLVVNVAADESVSNTASPEAIAEAEKLLSNMDMEAILGQSIAQQLDFQIQQSPELLPYRGVMQAFLDKHMSYASLKDDIVDLYSTTFSVQELKDISAFYSTETGKKTLQKLPALTHMSNQIGNERVQENLEELHQMLENAAKLVEGSKPI